MYCKSTIKKRGKSKMSVVDRRTVLKGLASLVLPGCGAAQLNAKNDNHVNGGVINIIRRSSVKVISEIRLGFLGGLGTKLVAPNSAWNVQNLTTLRAAGSGVALLSKDHTAYVVTANHVLPMADGSYLGIDIKNKRVRVGKWDGQVVKRNHLFDLGLIRLNGNLGYHFRGKVAESSEEGDYLMGHGFPEGEFGALFEGRLVARDVGDSVNQDIYQVFDTPLFMVADIHLTPGDSGGGIYVFDKGKPELAGLVQVGYKNKEGLKGMSPTEVLRGFLEDTPLEHYL
jgi:S1-C subfamily serine protease